MSYEPRPLTTTVVPLSAEMLVLGDRLAEHAHEVWARRRLAEGWSRGAGLDPQAKTHPGLIPFVELPEVAKQADRQLALETLRAAIALGWRIEPPRGGPGDLLESDERLAALLVAMNSPTATTNQLLLLWRDREPKVWQTAPAAYRRLAERFIKVGSPMIANEVATEGLEHFHDDLRLRQLQGLALAHSGATERANQILEDLEAAGHADEETLGILARTHKDLGVLSADPARRQKHLRLAYEMYSRAYRHSQGAWTGINAASVAMLLGMSDLAHQLAGKVQAACLAEWNRFDGAPQEPFWLPAMLGEAALLLEDSAAAEQWYGAAAAACRKQYGKLISARRQARLILNHLGRDAKWIEAILCVPRVVVCVGHMIDRPGRSRARFPPELEPAVRRAIRERLTALDGRIGFSSAACGADILFLESVLELGGDAHVVLPYDQEMFVRDSVDIVPGARWKDRFADVVSRATNVVLASSERMVGGSVSYDYANLVLHGLAAAHAGELESEVVGMMVWDGHRGDGPGGTATHAERWKRLGLQLEHIDLDALLKSDFPQQYVPVADDESIDWPSTDFDTCVMAMLFADAVNFSKLTEEQVPKFVQHFLGAIADLVERSKNTSVVRNTWGDGLYFVFDRVRDAGLFALELCDLVNNTRWAEKRLPAGLNLRIALHAGPVYRCQDPITKQINYTGTHVSRAARIEPITPPGQVYASQAFAALASVERIEEFVCEYVKLTPFAKGYGTFPTYLLRRAPAKEPSKSKG